MSIHFWTGRTYTYAEYGRKSKYKKGFIPYFRIICPVCNIILISKNYRKHFAKHKGNDINKDNFIVCSRCNKFYCDKNNIKTMREHLKN